jgi:hypothetical protein
MSAWRWVLVVGLLLVIVGLIGYARGRDHHHGDEVGALPGRPVPAVAFGSA